jgi:hypothetical protein
LKAGWRHVSLTASALKEQTMTDASAIPLSPVAAGPARRSLSRRTIGLAVAVAAGLAALLWTAPDASAVAVRQTDAELVMLLRFMAGVKALLALCALAAAVWRLGYPASPLLTTAYVIGPALMCAAPAVIWQMAHVAAGAALFHGGLVLLLLALYADRGQAPALVKARLLRMHRA